MEIYSIVAMVALGAFAVAYLLMVIAGFKANIWWGIGNLLGIPIVILPFIFVHWNKAKYSIIALVIACLTFGASILIQDATQKDQLLGDVNLGYQILLPKSWKQKSDLVPDAEIQMSREILGQFIVAFKVESAGTNLADEANLVAINIGSELTEQTITNCEKFDSASKESCQIKIEGCIDQDCFSYLLSSFKNDHYVVHLIAWGEQSKKEKNMEDFVKVRDSFQWL
jgi:hypothetical protein